MMPNIDPRQLKSMMERMGIKSSEIEAKSVTIACEDKIIQISEPQVTRIEAHGTVSFQISGNVSESVIEPKIEITEEDVKTVVESTGASEEQAKSALEESNGDIAEAIINLKKGQSGG